MTKPSIARRALRISASGVNPNFISVLLNFISGVGVLSFVDDDNLTSIVSEVKFVIRIPAEFFIQGIEFLYVFP